jgi:hypothetical protein
MEGETKCKNYFNGGMLEQVETNELQDIFTSIIEDADANILLLNEDFRIISLNPASTGFFWRTMVSI